MGSILGFAKPWTWVFRMVASPLCHKDQEAIASPLCNFYLYKMKHIVNILGSICLIYILFFKSYSSPLSLLPSVHLFLCPPLLFLSTFKKRPEHEEFKWNIYLSYIDSTFPYYVCKVLWKEPCPPSKVQRSETSIQSCSPGERVPRGERGLYRSTGTLLREGTKQTGAECW